MKWRNSSPRTVEKGKEKKKTQGFQRPGAGEGRQTLLLLKNRKGKEQEVLMRRATLKKSIKCATERVLKGNKGTNGGEENGTGITVPGEGRRGVGGQRARSSPARRKEEKKRRGSERHCGVPLRGKEGSKELR